MADSEQQNHEIAFEKLESDRVAYWRKTLLSYILPFKSRDRFVNSFLGLFPCIEWLPRYSWKNQFLGDLIGGLIGGVMHITKGTAYAQLAGIPPVNGLYALFLAGFIYPIFSFWSQGSMCSFAVIQLMCGSVVEELMHEYNSTSLNETLEVNPTSIVSTLTFMNGIMFLIFGLLRLQFLTSHLSKPLISGFLTAAVLHLITSQIGNVIGIKIIRSKVPFGQLLYNIYELIRSFLQTNLATLIISIVCFVFLLSTKFLLDAPIKSFVKSKRFIVPWELILMILVTITVYLFKLDYKFGVRTVGKVPTGLPNLLVPNFRLTLSLLKHSIAISIVQIAFHISLARKMKERKAYKVDELQEIYAMSVTHIFTGFFPSFPTTNGLGRAMVIDACGATSQICSIVSGTVVLLVLLSAGPLFYWIPLCVLAVIVLLSARELLKGFMEFPYYWSRSKSDGLIWITTFLASVCFDVIIGLAVGVACQMFTLICKTQWPKWTAETSNRIIIFKFYSMLVFSSIDSFNEAIKSACQMWSNRKQDEEIRRFFLLDASLITIIDTCGMETLLKLAKDLAIAYKCRLLFVGLDVDIQRDLQKMEQMQFEKDRFFETVKDAWDYIDSKSNKLRF